MSGETYTKLLSSITASTVWDEPHTTRIAWITMLAMADHLGRVHTSIPGLAHHARITLPEAEAALNCFLSPDRYSRNPANEGRRIEPIVGGWRLLNHQCVRDTRDPITRREYQRQWDREHRPSGYARQSDSPTKSDKSPTVRQQSDLSDQIRPSEKQRAKADAADAKRAHRLPVDWQPSDADIAFAEGERVNWRREAASFRDYWHSKAGRDATKTDWSATWRNWVRRAAKTTGPAQAPVKSKTLNAVETALRIANGQSVDGAGNRDGHRQASLLEAPGSARGRHDGWDDRGMG